MLSFYLIINLSKIKVKATQIKRQLLNKMAYLSGQFKLEIFHRWHYGAASAEPLAELVGLLLALAAAADDPAESKQLSQFRFRNTSMSAVSGEREARFWLITNPAVENADSEGTEVAGMHRYLRARLAIFGRRAQLSRQYWRMSEFRVKGVSER